MGMGLESSNNQCAADLDKFGYKQELKRCLPLTFLIFYGFAYMAPVTVFSTFGIVGVITHGMVAMSYVIALLAMIFTAYAYGRMVAAYPIAGSVYSYVQRSINPHVGFLSGWAILMDYMLLPMINYLLAGLFLAPVFPGVPTWVWIVGMVILVTIVNYVGIGVTAWVNNFLIIIQFIFVISFAIAIIVYLTGGGGAGTIFDIKGIYNAAAIADIGWNPIFLGASILCLSFLGFDGISTVTEEAINPEKNVGRAIMVVCVGAGILFIVMAYLMQIAWPMGWNEFKVVDSGAWELIVKVTATWVGTAFTLIYVLGCFASATASSSSAARLLYGMGRDGALPKIFAKVHPKFQTPVFSIIVMALIGLTALVLNLGLAASLINFGALSGFAMVNISVLAHYFIKNHDRSISGFIKYFLLPVIGAAICYVIWWSLSPDSKFLGFVWLSVGAIYLAATTGFFTKLPPEMKFEE